MKVRWGKEYKMGKNMAIISRRPLTMVTVLQRGLYFKLSTLKIPSSSPNEKGLLCLWKGPKQQIFINISAGAIAASE